MKRFIINLFVGMFLLFAAAYYLPHIPIIGPYLDWALAGILRAIFGLVP